MNISLKPVGTQHVRQCLSRRTIQTRRHEVGHLRIPRRGRETFIGRVNSRYSENNETESTGESRSVWLWSGDNDGLTTYCVFIGVLALGLVPQFQESKFGDLIYFISLAVCTIYIGAHRGINSRERQAITLRQGLIAPVLASASLFAMYLLIKYFPDLSFQNILDGYFFLLASFATIGAFLAPVKAVAQKMKFTWLTAKLDVHVPSFVNAVAADGSRVKSLSLYSSDILVAALGLGLAYADLASHHGNFTVNNAIACLIAADILNLVGLSSFRVAGILLVGMLLYDVTWVFASPAAIGENVMLKVATSDVISGPTRLLFPRIADSFKEANTFPFALLGLGDVAIPGLLCCLALRYDASRSIDMRARAAAAAEAIQSSILSLTGDESGDEIAILTGTAAENAYDEIANKELDQRERSQGRSTSGSSTPTVYSDAVLNNRVYFFSVMGAYVFGLVIAFAANEVTGLGQPALLYLVPSTFGALLLTSFLRKETHRIWNFRDSTSSDKFNV